MKPDGLFKGPFYKKVVLAYFISMQDKPISITRISEELGWSRRTVEENVKNLSLIGITADRVGAKKTGGYHILDWGPIKRSWVKDRYSDIIECYRVSQN